MNLEGEQREAAAPAADRRPGEALASFYEARGHRVVDAASALWVEYRWPFYVSVPFDRRFDPDARELAAALRAQRVPAVRYPTLTQAGWPSGMFVCSLASYSLKKLHPEHRRLVRRGLERCELRAVDPEELRALGPEVNLSALRRRAGFEPELCDPKRWRRLVAAVRRCGDVSVAGAFVDGRLAAYAINCRDGPWLHLLYKASRTEDLVHRASVALDHWVLAEAAKDPRLVAAHNAYVSMTDGAEDLHRYKQWMGCELVRHDLAIRWHPALERVLTHRATVAAAEAVARWRPRAKSLELAAKVLRGGRLTRAGASIPCRTVGA
jgi:hypothetical protein